MGFIVAAAKAIAGAFTAGGFFTTAIGRIVLSVGLSLLSQALAPRPPRQREPGMQLPGVELGEDVSQTFVMGRYATAGHMVYRNSHGTDGGTPNAWLTHVIEISDVPGMALESVVINDRPSGFASDPLASDNNTRGPALTAFPDDSGIHYRDGTQTAGIVPAPDDPYNDTDFPAYHWGAQMVGSGVCYAILSYRYDRKVFQGEPRALFVVSGIPLYDPREDDTADGEGPQRWDDRSTWNPSSNPAVMIYNILRGVEMPTGEVWGGRISPDDLPLSNWVAAMNICDEDIDGRPQFAAGIEVRVAEDEPADVVERLLRCCNGQIAEFGGVWTIRVGPPAAPALSITDEDISITDPQQAAPILGLDETFNAIAAQYIEPEELWQARSTDLLTDAALEAQHGGRRLPVELQLPPVTNRNQARQIAQALIRDHQRQRQHQFVLPPRAQSLVPLDDIQWTSEVNGYDDKDFEVQRVVFSQRSGMVAVSLRERDPDDYDWSAGDELPLPPEYAPLPDRPALQVLDWSVSAKSLLDDASAERRPAILLEWESADQDGVEFLEWQVRLASSGDVIADGVTRVQAGEHVLAEGVLAGTQYQARARYISDSRRADWTAWENVTTGDVRFDTPDLADEAVTIPVTAYTAGSVTTGPGAGSTFAQNLSIDREAGFDMEAFVTLQMQATGSGRVTIKIERVTAGPTVSELVRYQEDFDGAAALLRVVSLTALDDDSGGGSTDYQVSVESAPEPPGGSLNMTYTRRFLRVRQVKR